MAADGVRRWLLGETAALQGLLSGVAAAQFSLLEIVEACGESLAARDIPARFNATMLLANLFEGLTRVAIPQREMDVLVQFFCARMKDFTTAIPVFRALTALVQQPNFTGLASTVAQAFFQEFQLQTMAIDVRLAGFAVLAALLDKHTPELQPMGHDFVFGFIQQMDGEKDPRALLVLFSLFQRVVTQFPTDRFLDELFEICSCYFPITFTPPPGEKQGITRDDLIASLRSCLLAVPQFASRIVKLLLEKITTTRLEIKIDCLETLALTAPHLSTVDVVEFQSALQRTLRQECMESSEPLQVAAGRALTALVRVFSGAESSTLIAFLKPTLGDAVNSLQVPDGRLIRQFSPVLGAIASASVAAQELVLAAYVDQAILNYELITLTDYRIQLLSLLAELIRAADVVRTTVGAAESVEGLPLVTYRARLQLLFVSAIQSDNEAFRKLGIAGLATLLSTRVLSMPENVAASRQFTTILLSDPSKEVRVQALQACIVVANEFPPVAVHQIVGKLIEAVQGTGAEEVARQSTASDILQSIMSISVNVEVVSVTIPSFLRVLARILQDPAPTRSEDALFLRLACDCIHQIVASGRIKDADWVSLLVQPLLVLFLHAGFGATSARRSMVFDQPTLRLVADTIRLCVLASNDTVQADLTENVLQLFSSGRCAFLTEPLDDFRPLDSSTLSPSADMVALFSAVVSNVSRSVLAKFPALWESILPQLVAVARLAHSQPTVSRLAMCAAAILNKISEDQAVASLAASTLSLLQADLCAGEAANINSLYVLIWLAKGLVLRAHPLGPLFIKEILECLSRSTLAKVASDAFVIILEETSKLLNKASHAVIRPLYKQRFFQENIAVLLSGHEQAHDASKGFYLMALSNLLLGVPKQLLVSELPKVFPMLLESVRATDPILQETTLKTLRSLTVDAPELLSGHVRTLVEATSTLALQATTMAVRLAALQALTSLTVLPPHKVLPYVADVVRGIVPALDDRKRLVRQEAVICRAAWIRLSSPVSA
eukprot:m.880883 g.880883  ORF g.880883 m.880883 type:complete len:1009 (-) comp59857_c0_seq3:150-3176(-)